MANVLDVYLNNQIVGQLVQDQYGDNNFTYSQSWLENPKAMAISCSLPLQEKTFNRKQCRAFFEGILPEAWQRKLIAKNLAISDKNDFSMLEKIGGECAGELTFLPAGEELVLEKYDYREVSENELANLLQELSIKPLLAEEQGVRLSLAGVQDKLAVCIKNGKFYIPLNNAPSTHILKLDHSHYQNLIYNEAFCLKLAKQIGLSVAELEIKAIKNVNCLVVARYDREITQIGSNNIEIRRIHQEDFCQALAVPSTKKYQNEEGPSLKQCFKLLRDKSAVPVVDLERLLDAVIFNYFIGNCDAHGKNFSLLYLNNIQLAPLYDLVCTLYYDDLDKRMAMKLGGEYKIIKIRLENFYKLAEEIGFSKAAMRDRVILLKNKILSSLAEVETQDQSQSEIAQLIKERCEKF